MTQNMLDGGQVIVDYLIREKVPYAFGLCGHGNIQLIDALYERSSDIKTISVHHETVAGFMADVSSGPTRTLSDPLDVPQSVGIVTQSLLQSQQLQTVADAVQNVSGAQYVDGSASLPIFEN